MKSKKEREVIRILKNKHYLTRGVNETIPPLLQILMWELIEQMPVEKDYLQVFLFVRRKRQTENSTFSGVPRIQQGICT